LKITKQTQTKTTKVTPADEDEENMVVSASKSSKKTFITSQSESVNIKNTHSSNVTMISSDALLTTDMDNAIRQRNELEKWSKSIYVRM
jgi:hypothetical protein